MCLTSQKIKMTNQNTYRTYPPHLDLFVYLRRQPISLHERLNDIAVAQDSRGEVYTLLCADAR